MSGISPGPTKLEVGQVISDSYLPEGQMEFLSKSNISSLSNIHNSNYICLGR